MPNSLKVLSPIIRQNRLVVHTVVHKMLHFYLLAKSMRESVIGSALEMLFGARYLRPIKRSSVKLSR